MLYVNMLYPKKFQLNETETLVIQYQKYIFLNTVHQFSSVAQLCPIL